MARTAAVVFYVSLVAAIGVAAPRFASAQDREWWTIDLSAAAVRLMEAAPADPSARIAIVPISAADPATMRIADDVGEQLVWALQAVPQSSPRRVELIDRSSTAGKRGSVTSRPPVAVSDAVRAGKAVSAAYVVVGNVERSRTQLPERLELELVDVRNARVVQTAEAGFSLRDAPYNVAPREGSIKRPIIGAVGFAAAVGAAYKAWRANDDVKTAKTALLELPAGATSERNRLYDEAAASAKERDFWWGVSAGVAGVTTSYLVLTRTRNTAPALSFVPTVKRRLSRSWSISLTSGSQVSLSRTF